VFACSEAGIRDAITVGGGPHTFDCGDPMTVATEATIVIDNDVILDGRGDLTVDGNADGWVFEINAINVVAELRGFGVTGRGSGIRNDGTLTLIDSIVFGTAGTGVLNRNQATLIASTVSGNSWVIHNYAFVKSTVLTLTNSTVSGSILNFGNDVNAELRAHATVVNGTVSGSSALVEPGTVTLTNSLIDGDCSIDASRAVLVSLGYNIESPGNTCGFDQTGDQPGVTVELLNLGELAANGGLTMTHKPGDGGFGDGSVAIDVIPAADCVDADGNPLTTDQRGQPRPETGGTMCDVGAFEVEVQP
jgi:hypothetical protein